MPVTFPPECGPKCRSKRHSLQVNAVITRGSLRDLQAYSQLCHTWSQHTDVAGRSALHVAASCGKVDMVDWLLSERRQDPNQKDKESGWTALHRALFYGQLASARLLMQYASDPYCRDHEGLTPLDIIVKDRPRPLTYHIKDSNEVFTWGDNSNLTLGHSREQCRNIPEVVDTFRRQNVSIKQIGMSKYHSVFLTHTGQVFSCGHGHGGRLGHGDEMTCVTPRLVQGLQKEECVQVAVSRDHTLFLTDRNVVYCCGLNDCCQLGLTADKGNDRSLLPTKMNMKMLKGKKVLGVCAGRFHSVVYTADGVYTCGLNAGQLGHPKGERLQTQLRLVTSLSHKEVTVSRVDSSDAAIVCFTGRGDLFLLHQFVCRKIGSRWLDIEKVCVSGGNLDHNTDLDVLREKGGTEVKAVLLNKSGKVFMWRSCSPSLKRCHLALRRQVCVKDVSLHTGGVLLLTDRGEAFTGYLSGRKTHKDAGSREGNKNDNYRLADAEFGKVSLLELMLKDEVEELSLRRVPVIHRAASLACDAKGQNFAVTQASPNGWLTDVPCVSDSMIHTDYQQLFEEADVYDAIHDCVVQVDDHQWPVHLYILASRADYFRKQIPVLAASAPILSGQKPVINVSDVEASLMEEILTFIYTDTCKYLTVGARLSLPGTDTSFTSKEALCGDAQICDGRSVSAFEAGQRKGKGSDKGDNRREGGRRGEKDPVKALQEAARKLGVKGLSKRLESVKCVKGIVQTTGKKLPPPSIKYDRTKLGELYDVCIRAEDSTTIQCHKCVLAARLEYFHSMLGSGWIETSDTESLTLPIPGDILEILVDFVYQDESSAVAESQDTELLCNVLVVADQLLVQRLKELCEVALTTHMTLRNVGELLEIATAYNATQLVRACQQYVCLNLPALLESRNLDMVGEETMEQLTNYYRQTVGGMSCRIITPWSEGPDPEFLQALTADFDAKVSQKARDVAPKKAKSRRRQSRTKSGSEDPGGTRGGDAGLLMAERQISVSSDVSNRSEEEEAETEDSAVEVEPESPVSPSPIRDAVTSKSSVTQRHLSFTVPHLVQQPRPSKNAPSLPLATASSAATVKSPTAASVPSQNPESATSPVQGPGISLRNIMQEQQDTVRIVKSKMSGKFSWKDVKKQQNRAAQAQRTASSDSTADSVCLTPPAPASHPVCPWGQSSSSVVQSFRDLMLEDKSHQASFAAPARNPLPSPVSPQTTGLDTATSPLTPATLVSRNSASHLGKSPPPGASFSWGLPLRTLPQSTPSAPVSVPAAASPPDNPWRRVPPASPEAGHSAAATVSFCDIVQDQIHQKQVLDKAAQKPLHLIQMEEEAISQLLHQYGAYHRFDERIRVERVSGPIAAPLWNHRRNKSTTNK